MKKYNQIIVLSLVVYLCLALLSAYILLRKQDTNDHGYRVESNRIINQLVDVQQIIDFDLSGYQYIQKIEFLDNETIDHQIVKDFYLESNTEQIQILPFYQNNQLLGYLKFIYQLPQLQINEILIILEISLLILEAYLLIILWQMKRKLILPFHQLKELPLQLAKGHYKGTVKEEKGKYFGKFIWGMGQLKDTLDASKKRELELMKEKKRMLLSLSHDMKTPLNLIKLYNKALKDEIYTDSKQRLWAMEQIAIRTDEIEKYIDTIIKSSREDILDLHVNSSEFYLQDLMNNVLSVYKEQCNLRHIELLVDLYENKLLKGDLERSQEVFENLFENIFKYGDGRQIEITFREEDYCQLICIYNTGKTVTDTEFNHLFESFYRGANSQGKHGNGLGLYICHELMRKMDGMIFAEKSDDGMSFVLVFRED